MKRVYKFVIAIFIILIPMIVFFSLGYSIDFSHGNISIDRQINRSINFSEEKLEESNLIITISNQSSENRTIKITGYIDEEQILKGRFKTVEQHVVSYFYKNLENGKHIIRFVSEDGAEITEELEITDEKQWIFIRYNYYQESPNLVFKTQYEPFAIF